MKHKLVNIDSNGCSPSVLLLLDMTLEYAREEMMEFVTLEALLFNMVRQRLIGKKLLDYNVRAMEMLDDLHRHNISQDSLIGTDDVTTPSLALLKVFAEAEKKIYTSSGRKRRNARTPFITEATLLKAMLEEEESYAAFFLRKSLMDKTELFLDEMEDIYANHTDYLTSDRDFTWDEYMSLDNVYYYDSNEGEDQEEAYEQGFMDEDDTEEMEEVVEASEEEMLNRMMASAGRLMGALNALKNGQPIPTGEEDDDEETYPDPLDFPDDEDYAESHEPWEDLVTCINDTYMQHNPLIGRDKELERAVRILCRKDKNNPLFIGEPGVGKTAIIYGLVRMIENGKVPEWMWEKKVYALEISSLVAGASYHGEFEKRLKMVLEGARKKAGSIIYIDEIHTIAEQGNNSPTVSAGEILKPYLEDGALRFIGTTTYQDFNRTLANKKSIVRRFGLVDVKEPTTDEAVEIITALMPVYERFHGVKYDAEAIRFAVEQTANLIHDRFLPDKAIDIIDEAGAFRQQNPLLNKKGDPKQARFQKVDTELVKHIISDVCRIDAKAMSSESNDDLRNLAERMGSEIYGQDEAIRQVVRAVMMSKAGLTEPDKPIASLLFVGPTGVGKTEVCKVLARELGIELVRFDMSEYTEKHTVSKLIGSPAGYVGYDEGGLLTDAIRKTPNCVLLLDEIEKAHSDIYNILLQVMDYARLTDNKGNKASFRNVILVMTSNAGAQYARQAGIGFAGGETKGQAMLGTVRKTFKPEFLNRLSGTVVFADMDRHMASLVLDKKLRQLSDRLKAKGVTLELDDDAHDLLMQKGFNPQYGAREMDRAISQHLTPLLMEAILFGKLSKGGKAMIRRNKDDLSIG